MVAPQFRNRILRRLSSQSLERLQLRSMRMDVGYQFEFPGEPIRHLFFIEEGIASMTTTFDDGSQVELTVFGCDSVIGASAFMGTRRSLDRIYMQVAGEGWYSPIEKARAEFNLCEDFQRLALHYVQAQLVQATKRSACNLKHTIDLRLASWLSLCADRIGRDTVDISQTFLADMLGVTRFTVTIAAKKLRDDRLIDYRRGRIQIVDAAGLRERACECYQMVKSHLDNKVEFDQG